MQAMDAPARRCAAKKAEAELALYCAISRAPLEGRDATALALALERDAARAFTCRLAGSDIDDYRACTSGQNAPLMQINSDDKPFPFLMTDFRPLPGLKCIMMLDIAAAGTNNAAQLGFSRRRRRNRRTGMPMIQACAALSPSHHARAIPPINLF